jgi:hypothetical protein
MFPPPLLQKDTVENVVKSLISLCYKFKVLKNLWKKLLLLSKFPLFF